MHSQPVLFDMVPMTLEDVSKVAGNEKISHEFPWSENNFKDSINSSYWAYVLKNKCLTDQVEVDSGIIGHCIFMPGVDEIHLLNITVLPTYRRQQIATRVLRTIEPLAVQSGLTRTFLEVRVSNVSAIKLYEKCGYEEIARRKKYYRAGYDANGHLLHEDAIIMVKDLI
jgi:ribosomal-protein-alanine N-acetyltransferase